MRIPVYDEPQIAQQALPGVRTANIQTPLAGVAPALQGALNTTGAYFQQEMQKADQARAEDGLNQAQEQVINLKAQANQMKGANVYNVSQDENGNNQNLVQTGLSAYDKNVNDITGTLTNDNQRRMFQQGAQRMRLDLLGHLQNHQDQQGMAWQADTYDKGVELAVQGAGQAAQSQDVPGITNALARAKFLSDQKSELLGQTAPEELAVNRLQATSAVHASVLATLINGDQPTQAKAYFDNYRTEMTPGAQQQMENIIKGETTTMKATQAVDQVWTPDGKLEDMDKQLRQQFADDPETQRKAHAFLMERQSVHEKSVDEQNNATMGTLWKGVLAGQGASWLRQQPQFKALDGTTQVGLLTKVESFQRRDQDVDPTDPVAIAKRGFLFNNLLSKFRAGQLSQDEVYTNAPALGKSYTASLVSAIGDAQAGPQKVPQYKVDDTLLSSALRQAGLQHDTTTPAEESLQGDLAARIMLRQSASGVPWSQENTQKLIEQEIQPIITDPSSHWWTSDTKAPAFKAEDQVPQAFIKTVLGRNPNLSRNAITQAYFLAKKQNLLNPDGSYKVNL